MGLILVLAAAAVAYIAGRGNTLVGQTVGYRVGGSQLAHCEPLDLATAISRARNPGSMSPNELAACGRVLRAAGYHKTASRLRLYLSVHEELQSGTAVGYSPSQVQRPPATQVLSPPFRGPSPVAWSRFVRACMLYPKDALTPDGRYGYFGLFLRALVDAGVMVNERRERDPATGKVKYVADWLAPLNEEAFLSDTRLQYRVFAGLCSNWSSELLSSDFGTVLGTLIEGQPATLSGLLGVMRAVGRGGLEAWLSDPATRKPMTTSAYHHTNGIF